MRRDGGGVGVALALATALVVGAAAGAASLPPLRWGPALRVGFDHAFTAVLRGEDAVAFRVLWNRTDPLCAVADFAPLLGAPDARLLFYRGAERPTTLGDFANSTADGGAVNFEWGLDDVSVIGTGGGSGRRTGVSLESVAVALDPGFEPLNKNKPAPVPGAPEGEYLYAALVSTADNTTAPPNATLLAVGVQETNSAGTCGDTYPTLFPVPGPAEWTETALVEFDAVMPACERVTNLPQACVGVASLGLDPYTAWITDVLGHAVAETGALVGVPPGDAVFRIRLVYTPEAGLFLARRVRVVVETAARTRDILRDTALPTLLGLTEAGGLALASPRTVGTADFATLTDTNPGFTQSYLAGAAAAGGLVMGAAIIALNRVLHKSKPS